MIFAVLTDSMCTVPMTPVRKMGQGNGKLCRWKWGASLSENGCEIEELEWT